MYDKDEIIERLDDETVINILNEFGIIPYRNTDKEIIFPAICHGTDKPKLYYYKKTKKFVCYSQCGKMNIFNLLIEIHTSQGVDFDFGDAVKFVALRMGMKPSSKRKVGFSTKIDKELELMRKHLELKNRKKKELIKIPPIRNQYLMNYFDESTFYEGWIKDGISIETMEYFNVCFSHLTNAIIIPHKNLQGEIVGIRRRTLLEAKSGKYMPLALEGHMYSHSLNLNLYGLYENLHGILKTKKAVITEGEKSPMLAREYYGKDAFTVATCGFNISNWHRDILVRLGVEEVMIALDKDFLDEDFYLPADDPLRINAIKGKKRIKTLASKFTPFCRTYILWDRQGLLERKDSPFDKGKEVLEKIMQDKIEITE